MTELDSRPKRPSHNCPHRLMKECGSKVRLIFLLTTLKFEARNLCLDLTPRTRFVGSLESYSKYIHHSCI